MSPSERRLRRTVRKVIEYFDDFSACPECCASLSDGRHDGLCPVAWLVEALKHRSKKGKGA